MGGFHLKSKRKAIFLSRSANVKEDHGYSKGVRGIGLYPPCDRLSVIIADWTVQCISFRDENQLTMALVLGGWSCLGRERI
jgi:hypothetical protein